MEIEQNCLNSNVIATVDITTGGYISHRPYLPPDCTSNMDSSLGFIMRCMRDLVPFVSLRNVKNTHGGVLLFKKLPTLVCNFTKSNNPTYVFFTFFKLHK